MNPGAIFAANFWERFRALVAGAGVPDIGRPGRPLRGRAEGPSR